MAARWGEEFYGQRDRAHWRAALTDYLEGGESLAVFLEQYPSVTREAAIAALEEARDSLVAHLG